MLSAEKKCARPPAPPVSRHLAGLSKIVRYWKTVKSGMATGRDVTAATTAIREELPKSLVPKTIKKNPSKATYAKQSKNTETTYQMQKNYGYNRSRSGREQQLKMETKPKSSTPKLWPAPKIPKTHSEC
jgi:hypothetical protein